MVNSECWGDDQSGGSPLVYLFLGCGDRDVPTLSLEFAVVCAGFSGCRVLGVRVLES